MLLVRPRSSKCHLFPLLVWVLEYCTVKADLKGLQMRDLRHTWKTNAQRSGMDPTVRDLIVGHSNHRLVADRYIRVSDEELLKAVDNMRFDNGWTELDLVEEA